MISSTVTRDDVLTIFSAVAAHALVPALTNILQSSMADSTTPQTTGLTQEEIDDVTTEMSFHEITNPTNTCLLYTSPSPRD